MALLVICAACRGEFRAQDRLKGRVVQCPRCAAAITITGEAVPDFDAFVSFADEDRNTADAACSALEAKRVRCWIAHRDAPSGVRLAEAIIEAIGRSRAMVLVYSGHANRSAQVMREVERAVSKGLAVVPFRIEAAPLSPSMEYFISASHWLDAVDGPLEDNLARLAAQVRRLLVGDGDATLAVRLLAAGVEPRPAGIVPAVAPAEPASAPVEPASRTNLRQMPDGRGGAKVRRVAGSIVAAGAALVGILVALAVGFRGTLGRRTAPDAGTVGVTPDESRAAKSARLLAIARANDSTDLKRADAARAALDEILRAIDPENPEARSLYERISGYRRTYTNTLDMQFVEVKPGEFFMGSPPYERWRFENETQHRVTLTTGYMLGVYEVTRGQFAKFVKANGYRTDAEKYGAGTVWSGSKWESKAGASWRNPGFDQVDDHPVVLVSWNDAVAFARWLSRAEGRNYRLPTEAEWEFAARAGTKTAYPWAGGPAAVREWANALDPSTKDTFQTRPVASGSDGFPFTAPVGRFRPNDWGFYDMIGNVWEWCQDSYGPHTSADATNPTGPGTPPAADKVVRVLRGAAWVQHPQDCRAAYRLGHSPTSRMDIFGFRLCLDLGSPAGDADKIRGR